MTFREMLTLPIVLESARGGVDVEITSIPPGVLEAAKVRRGRGIS